MTGAAVMTRAPSNLKAALWVSGWLIAMLVMIVAGRETTREIAVFQVMEMRSIIGLFMLYPLVHAAGGLGAMKTDRAWLHIARNSVHYGAQYAWFAALTLIPLAQVVSIEFTMPIWTALLAMSFLGERMTIWKTLAIVMGLVGVAVIVRPGLTALNPGQLVALGAAIGFGIAIVMIKLLTRTETTVAIIFWMLVIQSAIGFIPALDVWVWPSTRVWLWMLPIAFCGTYSHYCMSRAMLYADATIVVPMDFLRVPLTVAVGYLIYAERVDLYTALGTALILAANSLNLIGARGKQAAVATK
jgi:drug/metabolite transporter (DMT)-like permease